jgi:hypothetical protein
MVTLTIAYWRNCNPLGYEGVIYSLIVQFLFLSKEVKGAA